MNTGVLVAGFLVVILAIAGLIGFEVWWRNRPQDQLELHPERWSVDRSDPHRYRIAGKLLAHNHNPTLEVTLAQLQPQLQLLSRGSITNIHSRIAIQSSEAPRPDNYWIATIISPQTELPIEVSIELWGEGLAELESTCLWLEFVQYGRQVRTPKLAHIVLPLQEPPPATSDSWQERDGARVMPVKTHLLNAQDDLPQVVDRYIVPLAEPGDYVALAESAVAIVEGNYRHPSHIRLSWLARRLCYLFPSKTSLSSAYGMQTLIDTSNPWRVVGAVLLGAIAKGLGKQGVFYALAGHQAALLDDLTGTLPPYDQFLVLGPDNPSRTVEAVKAKTGLETAIVDVNDLREVKILAATSGIVPERVIGALRENPAGNSAEQTPLVLIRPSASSER
jgi:hypothetical protein